MSTSETPLFDLIDHGRQNRNATFATIHNASARRALVLRCIVESGSYGITLDELSERFGVAPNAISGRISELKKLGLVRHTSQRRPTRAGSTASVILAAPAGKAEVG